MTTTTDMTDDQRLARRARRIRLDAARLLVDLEAGAEAADLPSAEWRIDGIGLSGRVEDEAAHQAWTAHLGARAERPAPAYRPHKVMTLLTEVGVPHPASDGGVRVRLSAEIDVED